MASTARARTVWLLDESGETITSLNPTNGQLGQPRGLTGTAYQAILARASIWVAAGAYVDRISLVTGQHTAIAMPKGTDATGIAVDPTTNTVWVDSSLSAE